MENATKAIFIASALIIALALISLIVSVFIKNKVLVDDGSTKVDFATVSYHNSQFTVYEKDNLSYSEIVSFIGKIVENNNRQTDEDYMLSIDLEKYELKSGGIYKASGIFETVEYPVTNNFMSDEKYIYFDFNSAYRGKVFKVSLLYNDRGIIDKAKIQKIN